ncbi:MAG: hypothetical protein WAO11_20570 [Candidatus Acidiferrum sp.]
MRSAEFLDLESLQLRTQDYLTWPYEIEPGPDVNPKNQVQKMNPVTHRAVLACELGDLLHGKDGCLPRFDSHQPGHTLVSYSYMQVYMAIMRT